MRAYSGVSKRTQKKILEILRDMQEGGVARHRLFGTGIDCTEAYRKDNRYYTKKTLPQDYPDMAVSILMDGSGSMCGLRETVTRNAGFLLYDFCAGLGIPVHVASHNTRNATVCYTVYADFDRVGNKDRYRIGNYQAGGENRDGMAIEIAAGLLVKRPEPTKLLFIICDGQPSHVSTPSPYGGEPARLDIQKIVKSYKRRGVEVIAAAIGDDKDMIKQIYGDGYLDISDLNQLPKTLVSIVKRRIISV